MNDPTREMERKIAVASNLVLVLWMPLVLLPSYGQLASRTRGVLICSTSLRVRAVKVKLLSAFVLSP